MWLRTIYFRVSQVLVHDRDKGEVTYAEEREVDRHRDQRDDECDGCDDRSDQASNNTRHECDEEGKEGNSASHRVQDHDPRQAVGSVASSAREVGAERLRHDIGGRIADHAASAPILAGVGVVRASIEDAVAEGAEGDRAVAHRGAIREGDAQERDVVDHRGGDGGDEEEDGGGEEEEGSYPVKSSSAGHCGRKGRVRSERIRISKWCAEGGGGSELSSTIDG